MKKVLIAVDDTKGTKAAVSTFSHISQCMNPESIILLYVEKFEGRSLMDEMLGEPELSTLREVLKGTEYQEALDKKANRILEFYKKSIEEKGVTGIKTVVKSGHPAEEILKTAKDENVDMIIIGSRGNRTHTLFIGSASREVVYNAEVPVLIVR